MATKVKSRPTPKTKQPTKPPAVVKTRSRPVVSNSEPEPLPESWLIPPITQDECLERIQALSKRVEGYVRFMHKIDDVRGTSAEAKQRALIAFYERLLFFEKELGRVQEDLQLG